MKMFKDEELLDEKFRKKVIEEIFSKENTDRRNEALRRHEIYRDKIKKWVMEALAKEGLKEKTLAQMENRAANVSICRKIINKLARLYVGGVERTVKDAASQIAISELSKIMRVDTHFKKSERFKKLQKNCLIGAIPEIDSIQSTDEQKKYKIKTKVFNPWQYDAIEDAHDHEKARVILLSDFINKNGAIDSITDDDGDGRFPGITPNFHGGNRKDEIIADSPEDALMADAPQVIWWNHTYHFTTDLKGRIIPDKSPEDLLNPIQMLPFCVANEDQDGEFWAQGGDDLVDGTILVNQLLTDMNSIQYIQGWGQPVITGKNVKSQTIEGGPHTAIVLEYDDEDPKPEVGFVSANPAVDVWMRTIEQYVALLLTTNNLSPSNVAGKLDANHFPSGVAMLIENSQATDSTEESQKDFQSCEREFWEITRRWIELYFERDALTEEFMEVGPFTDSQVTVKYNDLNPVMTEQEKLDNIGKRKELGINTEIELLKLDNPDLDDEAAEEKLKKIKEERMKRQAEMMENALNNSFNQDDEDDDEDEDG